MNLKKKLCLKVQCFSSRIQFFSEIILTWSGGISPTSTISSTSTIVICENQNIFKRCFLYERKQNLAIGLRKYFILKRYFVFLCCFAHWQVEVHGSLVKDKVPSFVCFPGLDQRKVTSNPLLHYIVSTIENTLLSFLQINYPFFLLIFRNLSFQQ